MLRRLLHFRARESRNRRDRVEEQDLRDVRVREVYRTRSKDEVELAEWEGNERTEAERSTYRDTDEEKDGVSTPGTPVQVAWVRPARTKPRNQRREEHTLAFKEVVRTSVCPLPGCKSDHKRQEKRLHRWPKGIS